MKILEARPHVVRKENGDTIGILALVKDKVIKFAWFDSLKLDSKQLSELKELGTLEDVQEGEDCMLLPLDAISIVKIEPQLSLYDDKACCLTSIQINSDDLNIRWPELWFNPLNGRIDSPIETIYQLRLWIRSYSRDLVSLGDEAHCYVFTDKLEPMPELIHPHWQKRAGIHKIGTFGLGLVSSLFGTPVANSVEDFGWDALQGLSKVTIFAKDQTNLALKHPLARPLLPMLPEKIRSVFLSSDEVEELLSDYVSAEQYLKQYAAHLRDTLSAPGRRVDVVVDTKYDFENIKQHYNAHFTGTPLTLEVWESWLDDKGKLMVSPFIVACTVFCGGIEPSLRPRVWPFILGFCDWNLDAEANLAQCELKIRDYSNMKSSWMEVLKDAGNISPKQQTIPNEGAVGDENENIDVVSKLLERKYRIDKDVARTDQTIEFFFMEPMKNDESLRSAIDKQPELVKLRNILMTYTMYNFELGYVQGMNDLAAPILEILHEEPAVFWCYVAVMEKMKPNFYRDQSGMHTQLRRLELLLKLLDPPLYEHLQNTDSSNMFCCFRWLLIMFKREFYFEDIKSLWEISWMCPLTNSFHLFMALAILNENRQALFQARAFDEILKEVNGLSQKISVPTVAQHAEIMFYLFRDQIVAKKLEGVDTAALSNTAEIKLGQISGIYSGDVELKQNEISNTLDEVEWLELVPLLEIDFEVKDSQDTADSWTRL